MEHDIKNAKHREVVNCINRGEEIASICSRFKMTRSNYGYIKQKYAKYIYIGQPFEDIAIDIDKYNTNIIEKSKYIALRICNTLQKKSFTNQTIGQLTQSLVAVNNLVRLEEGKSTENIAHQVIHNLNPEQLELVRESIKNLKKSMLLQIE